MSVKASCRESVCECTIASQMRSSIGSGMKVSECARIKAALSDRMSR